MIDRCGRDQQEEARKGLRKGAAGDRPTPALALSFCRWHSSRLHFPPAHLACPSVSVQCVHPPHPSGQPSAPSCSVPWPPSFLCRHSYSICLCPCERLRDGWRFSRLATTRARPRLVSVGRGENSRAFQGLCLLTQTPTTFCNLPSSGGWGGPSTHSHPPGRTSGRGQPQRLLGIWQQNQGGRVEGGSRSSPCHGWGASWSASAPGKCGRSVAQGGSLLLCLLCAGVVTCAHKAARPPHHLLP